MAIQRGYSLGASQKIHVKSDLTLNMTREESQLRWLHINGDA